MDSNNVLISVIIPSYNRADTVGQTIDSILHQKVNADIEIVIGDDCSTDTARDVLLSYKSKYPEIIKLIFHESNIGLGANWATCAKECKGDYICNCDNDDYWHNPRKLELQFKYMESNPDCNVLITDHRTHNRKTGEIKEKKAVIQRGIPLQDSLQRESHFCNATIMYRAEFLKSKIKLDDFIEKRFYLQDWPVWIILSAYTDFDILPVSTATFGIETASITRPDSIEKIKARLDKEYDLYLYLNSLFPDKFQCPSVEEHQQYVYRTLLKKSFKVGDYENARKYGEMADLRGCDIYKIISKNIHLFKATYAIRQMIRKIR